MNYLLLLRRSIARDGWKKTFYKCIRALLTNLPTISYLSYHLHRLFKGGAVREIHGSKMFLDLRNDVGISRDLFIYGRREIICTDLMMHGGIIKEGDVVLDIGANIGYYALVEARLVGEKGLVYALEPVSKNFHVLKRNIALNGVRNIELYQLAAGDTCGVAYINVSRQGNLSSMVRGQEGYADGQEKVHLVTVDEFLKNRTPPALIRFDVEGYEYAIVRGMCKTLEHKPRLFIEVHGSIMTESQIREMFAVLKEKHYGSAVVAYETYVGWVLPELPRRWLIGRFTSKIKEAENIIGTMVVSLDDLLHFLLATKRTVHAFFGLDLNPCLSGLLAKWPLKTL